MLSTYVDDDGSPAFVDDGEGGMKAIEPGVALSSEIQFPADWADDDPNVIDAEVVEDDDHTPLVPREPEAQTRHDRAAFAEVERANRGRAREREGGDSRAAALRAEAEALGMDTPRHSSEPGRRRAGGRSDDTAAMNAQQDEEDAILQRVKDAERRKAEQARGGKRVARVTTATNTDKRSR